MKSILRLPLAGCLRIAANVCIGGTKIKTMTVTNLGLWYVQIPSGIVVSPMGEIIEPKTHNGSKFVLIKRERKAISKLPHLDKKAAMEFKEIFCQP